MAVNRGWSKVDLLEMALNVHTYCILYVLARNECTYCTLYVLPLQNSTLLCVASYPSYLCCVRGMGLILAIVSAWHLVLGFILNVPTAMYHSSFFCQMYLLLVALDKSIC